MNFGLRELDNRYELDLSLEDSDITFEFKSVREDHTGDIIFDGTGLNDARINQTAGDDIGVLSLEKGHLTVEARANFNDLLQELAQRTDYHHYE